MSNETQQAEAPDAITMESLFPTGKVEKQPELEAVTTEGEESSNSEDLAEVQETEEQEDVSAQEQEAVLGKIGYNEVMKQAGVDLESAYRDIFLKVGEKEVSVSELVDGRKALEDANDALLRERTELQKRLDQSATMVPQQEVSPEANALMSQAGIRQQEMMTIAQDPNLQDNPAATRRLITLQLEIQQLAGQAQAKQMEWNQKRQEKEQAAIAERDRQTRAQIPEWNDANVQATEWRGISDMLTSYGVQHTDIKMFPPAERRLLRDAWRATNQAKRLEQGAKRIKKVSKTLPAASRVPMKSKPSREEARETIRSAKTRDEKLKAMLTVDLGG